MWNIRRQPAPALATSLPTGLKYQGFAFRGSSPGLCLTPRSHCLLSPTSPVPSSQSAHNPSTQWLKALASECSAARVGDLGSPPPGRGCAQAGCLPQQCAHALAGECGCLCTGPVGRRVELHAFVQVLMPLCSRGVALSPGVRAGFRGVSATSAASPLGSRWRAQPCPDPLSLKTNQTVHKPLFICLSVVIAHVINCT